MTMLNTNEEFGSVTKFFHWSIAILVFTQVIIVNIKQFFFQEETHRVAAGFLIGELHKPIGVLVLGLAVLGLIWHTLNRRPKLPPEIPGWQVASARLVHSLLYVLVITMALSGIMMSAAAGYPVNFFHLGTITFGIGKDPDPHVAEHLFNIHKTTASILIALISLHILAALKHHYVDKNNVLRRMWFGKNLGNKI